MNNNFHIHARRQGKATIAALVGLVLVIVIAVLIVSPQIKQQLSVLRSASADNYQWALAQVEVDILQMQNAGLRVQDGGSLDTFRRRYDIFYSRVKLLTDGSEFEAVRQMDTIGPRIEILSGFLETSVPVVDGDDALLRQALPVLVETLDELRREARAASLAGVAAFGEIADEKRENFLAILWDTALVALAIVLAMIALTFVLIRQVRISQQRGEEVFQKNIRLDAAIDASMTAERAKSRFLAVMSHEMRTPLNGMIGTLELMAGSDLSGKQQKYLGMAQSSCEILLHHVNDVLDISKIESDHLTLSRDSFNPANLLREICDTNQVLADERGNNLTLKLPVADVPRVTGDSMYLRQILLNLLSNAIKFTQDGHVVLEMLVPEQTSTKLSLEFRVIDTGIGISQDDLARVFDDFVTLDSSFERKVGGTGLGLGISRRLAKAMGGEVGVESVTGDGSVFWLRLKFPICEAGPVLGEATETPPEPALKLDILVAEDNQINAAILSEVLENGGHRVTHAANGKLAVDAASHTRFDLILMDISMPVMDGITATKNIRTGGGASQNTTIFALTAHALPDQQQSFLDVGMQGCLIKPIRQKDIAALLNKVELGTDEPDHSETAIDTDLLSELFEVLGADKYNALKDRFLIETSSSLKSLISKYAACSENTNNVAGPDQKDIQAELHRLAGAAANFGARALREELIALERLCESAPSIVMQAQLNQLENTWARSKALIGDMRWD